MSDWTEAEQAAIEKAAERLEHVMVNLDAVDAAYDIAKSIQPEVAATALEWAADNYDGALYPENWLRNLADRIRAEPKEAE